MLKMKIDFYLEFCMKAVVFVSHQTLWRVITWFFKQNVSKFNVPLILVQMTVENNQTKLDSSMTPGVFRDQFRDTELAVF